MRISDWSSDVCSSDLGALDAAADGPARDARGERSGQLAGRGQGERALVPLARTRAGAGHLQRRRLIGRDHIGAADRLALRPVRLARHFPAHWRARLYLARPLALVLQGRSRQASGTRRGRTPNYPDRPPQGGAARRPPPATRPTAALSPELGRHPVALLPPSRLVALRLVAADLSGRKRTEERRVRKEGVNKCK